MPIYMTAQYQVHPSKIEKVKKSIRPLVEHVKNHEPLTTIYIAQQQILNPSKFMHILRFEDEAALRFTKVHRHQRSLFKQCIRKL